MHRPEKVGVFPPLVYIGFGSKEVSGVEKRIMDLPFGLTRFDGKVHCLV